MKPVMFGTACGLIYFGLAMLGIFDGIETWRVVMGVIAVGMGVAVFVEGVRR